MQPARIARGSVALLVSLLLFPALAKAATPPVGVSGIALDGHVQVAWHPVASASGYAVYRGTTAGAITTRVTPVGGTLGTSFTDTAANGAAYYYAVRSIEAGFESANSPVIQASPAARSCNVGNPVVLENCMPGSANWPARATAAPASGGIEGYATAQSVNHGEDIQIKVNATAGAPYNIEVYRSGDYGGQGGRLFSVIRGLSATAQPACSNNSSTGLYDCAAWSVSATIPTTTTWPSGMYLLRLVRTDTNSDTHVLVAVRDDSRTPEVVFGSGFSTFNAYNSYGGRSLYEFQSGGSNTVAGTARAVKVSFDRPFQQIRQRQHDWYTEIEQPLVAWLERQGYDISYISGTDLETNGALARRGHAYISPGHDEYISANVRTALEQARDAGVGLFFTGANAIFWKVRYEASGVSGEANRVMVCYKTTQSGAADPVTPTTTWRDATGANKPENALIGQMYIGQNTTASYPLKVTAQQGTDRLYRYTGLDSLAPGTTATIGSTIYGWEWDGRVNNGQEPAGVKTVAGSAVSGDVLTDAGRVYAPGPATANVTKYKAASGALVVSTGTNQWWRGLMRNIFNDGEPGPEIQQITMNALADMGAHPATPTAGLQTDAPAGGPPAPTGVNATAVGTDSIAISWNPVAGATGYSVFRMRGPREDGYPLGARANGATVTATSFTDTGLDSGFPYYYVVTATVGGVQSTPSNEASATTPVGATPAIRINTGGSAYTSVSGVTWTADQRFTGGSTSSTTQSISGTTDPALYQNERWGNFSYAIPVPNGTYDVRMHFAETYFGTSVAGGAGKRVFGMDVLDTPGSPDLANIDIYAAVGPRAALVRTVSGVTVTDGTLNIASVRGAADDPEVTAIEVVPAPPPGPPAVTQRTPGDGSSAIDVTVRPTATFSRAMDASTLTASTFTLKRASDLAAVTATVSYDATTKTVTLRPTSALAFNTTYRAQLTTAVKSSDGSALANAVTWTFTTGDPPPPPTVSTVTPVNGANAIARNVVPSAQFSRDLDPATVTTSSFTLTPSGGSAVAATVSYDAATQTARVTPTSSLAYATTYTARLTTAVKGIEGVALASPVTWTFTTLDPPPPDTTAPTVSVTAPADGATVIGAVSLQANAADNVAVTGVQFKVDGANVGSEDTSAPYQVTWSTFGATANGQHTITAVAHDEAGNTKTATAVNVTVTNPAVDPNGLVGAWGFEEPSGTTALDASLARNDGTLGTVTRTASGKFGAALTFSGTSGSWVSVPSSTSLDLGGAMTLEGWVRPSALASWSTVMLRERPGAMAYSLYANTNTSRPSGHVSIANNEQAADGTAAIPLNTWTHLATTYDGSIVRLYVNGTQVATKAASGTLDTSSGVLRIGGNNVWNEPFNGIIDEVRVYKRALSPAEITTDMNSPVRPATPDTSPPTVSLTAPAAGATVSGTATVSASASDDRGVANVQFKLDGANLGSPDTSAPFQISWNTAAAGNGSHQLTAVASDGTNTTTSAVVNVTVDNGAPPTVSLTAPAAGATLSDTVTLQATANDDRGIASVQFKVDGSGVGSDTSAPYSVAWDSRTVTNGSHSITAVATDSDGNATTSAVVNVTTSNAITAPPGLVAAYGFEETSGTTVTDSSTNALTGSFVGATRVTTGRIGRALSFTGTGNLVTIPDAAPLHLTTGMTLEAWVNPTSTSGWRTVMLKEQTGAMSYALYANTNTNQPSGHVNTGNEVDTRGSAQVPANAWTHLAATYDGSTLRMFVNGTQTSSVPVTGTIAISPQPLRIGGNSIWGEYFNGLIDEVRVYNRALTAPEIQGDLTRAVP